MKKILTIVFIFFTVQSFAQGNLQFNQVKTFSGSSWNASLTIDTVPQGKIWKIESMGFSGVGNSAMTINGARYINYLGSYYSPYNSSLPNSGQVAIKETLWLKSGDVLGWEYGNYVITLIEYKIIP
jgi:hypothetical protein